MAGQKPKANLFKNRNMKVPTLSDLNYDFVNSGGYQFAYTLVDFIIKKNSKTKLNQLIRNPKNLSSILGMNEDEFYKKWETFLFNEFR